VAGAFRFHDSLTRTVREFTTIEPGEVRMYNCGPTVYGKQTIGNYRTYVCWDVLRRALEFGGFKVRQIVNITDVGHLTVDDVADATGEDKLELAARRDKLDAWAVAKKYTEYHFEALRKLNILPAERFPRATDHVPEMIAHIEALIAKGHAYKTPAGNVYFAVSTFPGYGKLSGNTVEALVAGARVEVLDEKRHPADFALWKRDEKHQMQWDSPWGRGFPGWHIECSAMSRKYLGDTLDIHTGGEDNAFPHHECEIAQSEALTGKPFVRYWMHSRFLLVDGARMAKSKGNLYTVEDVEERGFPPRVLRYFLMSAHYRAPMNFTWEGLEGAKSAVESLDAMVRGISESQERADRPDVLETCEQSRARFLAALQDDLNISNALAVVHDFRAFVNREGPYSQADTRRIRDQIIEFNRVLGIGLDVLANDPEMHGGGVYLGPEVERLIFERRAARQTKDFARADAIRKQLDQMGVVVEDTPNGLRWYRK
jgi:cysteinyl-tRNA synthetase